jgi:hypothetical protein
MAPKVAKKKSLGPSGVLLTVDDDLKQMVENEVTLNQAKEFIVGCPYLYNFRCEIGVRAKEGEYTPYGLPLIDVMKTADGRKKIDVAMQATICSARGDGWKSSNDRQRSLGVAAGYLMVLMKMKVEPEIASIAIQTAADYQTGGTSSSSRSPVAVNPLNTKVLDDGCRYLYMIQVPDCMVFKLGTFKADHARGRMTVLDRYLGREKPPALPTCTPVNWLGDALVVKHLVQTSTEDEKPDVPIHAKLRELAKAQELLECGQTEFHDRALWFNCKQLVDEMADGLCNVQTDHVSSETAVDAPSVDKVHGLISGLEESIC